MKITLSAILILLSFCLYAAENFPKGCKPLAVQGESIQLSSGRPTLVLLHNLSSTDLWVTHPVSEPNASAGWSTRLQAKNWTALALNEKSFDLSCIESRPGHEQQIACAGVLVACQWKKVTSPKSAASTYWAVEDTSLSQLLAQLGGRGFTF